MKLLAKPLAKAIIWGGNPVARVINRTSHIAARIASRAQTLYYNRGGIAYRFGSGTYEVEKTRNEISEILRDKLYIKWTWDKWQNLPRTSIVFSRDKELYMGPAGRFLDRFMLPHSLPDSAMTKLAEGNFTREQRDSFLKVLQRAAMEGWNGIDVERLNYALLSIMNRAGNIPDAEFISNGNRIFEIGNRHASKYPEEKTQRDHFLRAIDLLIMALPQDVIRDSNKFDIAAETAGRITGHFLSDTDEVCGKLGDFLREIPFHLTSDQKRLKCILDMCEKHLMFLSHTQAMNYFYAFRDLLKRLPVDSTTRIKDLEEHGTVFDNVLSRAARLELPPEARRELLRAVNAIINKLPVSSLSDYLAPHSRAETMMKIFWSGKRSEDKYKLAQMLIETMPPSLIADSIRFEEYLREGFRIFGEGNHAVFFGVMNRLRKIAKKLDEDGPEDALPLMEYGEMFAGPGKESLRNGYDEISTLYDEMGTLIDSLPPRFILDRELLKATIEAGKTEINTDTGALSMYKFTLQACFFRDLPEKVFKDKKKLRIVTNFCDEIIELELARSIKEIYPGAVKAIMRALNSILVKLPDNSPAWDNLDAYKDLLVAARSDQNNYNARAFASLCTIFSALISRLTPANIEDISVLKGYWKTMLDRTTNLEDLFSGDTQDYTGSSSHDRLSYDVVSSLTGTIEGMPLEVANDPQRFAQYLLTVNDLLIKGVDPRLTNYRFERPVSIPGYTDCGELMEHINVSLKSLPDRIKADREYLKWFLSSGKKALENKMRSSLVGCLYVCFAGFITKLPERTVENRKAMDVYMEMLQNLIEHLGKRNWDVHEIATFLYRFRDLVLSLPASSLAGQGYADLFNYSSDSQFALFIDNFKCHSILTKELGIPIEFDGERLDQNGLKKKLVHELRSMNLRADQLDKLAAIPVRYLEESGMKERICELARTMIVDFPSEPQYSDEAGFMLSVAKLAAHWDSMIEDDQNVPSLYQIVKRYGSFAAYYRAEKAGILRQMKRAGFDVDYILGGEEVLARGLNSEEIADHGKMEWPDSLRVVLQRILGTRERRPEITFGFNKRPGAVVFNLNRLRGNKALPDALAGDKEAAKKIISSLLEQISEERKKNKNRVLEEWHDLLSGISGSLDDTGTTITSRGLRAVRSRKLLPEMLFDNERLGCCIFKPNGSSKDEISLLLLDPKTPLLEIWLEGNHESMGIATQYLGTNAKGQPVVFVDTFEASHLIYDSMGRNPSLRFSLDAMVLDAQRMGAKEMAIFACPYGKPAEFVNFVKDQIGPSNGSMVFANKYRFTSLDVDDESLSDSKAKKHHYTDAFGEDKEIVGEKDCIVIDVNSYIEKVLGRAK